jgi:hypothetical protein
MRLLLYLFVTGRLSGRDESQGHRVNLMRAGSLSDFNHQSLIGPVVFLPLSNSLTHIKDKPAWNKVVKVVVCK